MNLETTPDAADEFQTAKLATLGRILSEVLHDLRNPLSILSTSLETVRDAKDKERALAMTLDLMLRNVERSREIINSLLDFSRLKPFSFKPADLRAVVGELLDHLRLKCEQQHIELGLEAARDLPPVELDVQHVKGALLNLLMNAVEAMPKGGSLTVGLASSDGRVSIRVADTGGGVREADRPRLFERYFTTKPHGTGLGLIMVREVVRQHGGSVEFESVPGKGTAFTVRLPVRQGS
ncbi:MAG: ATP-binding protein [Elusimicrobiota bacterium]